ncbi:MAG: hypothetical protein CMJ83_07980 [Planctomycetes bacterium]|nr:hypothetical protein [Planctomycetota bacterium]
MSVPETDLLGNPLTDIERGVAEIHASIAEMLRRDDLTPCVRAGLAHALASTWQVMNDLDVPGAAPEDV